MLIGCDFQTLSAERRSFFPESPATIHYAPLPAHYSLPNPSHQTRKFPPTPSIHSTSRVSFRKLSIQYCTLTVMHFSVIILCVSRIPVRFSAWGSSPTQILPAFSTASLPRTRSNARNSHLFMPLLHDLRTPGVGLPSRHSPLLTRHYLLQNHRLQICLKTHNFNHL